MHFSDLPTEIHTYILAFTCAHIPSAGESPIAHTISRVSSYWNAVAQPFKYHSLRVTGAQACGFLLERLEKLPERERRVRYLHLSDRPAEIEVEELRLKSTIARLLCLLAPSLHELELHLADPAISTSLFAALWELSAPHLRSLSVKGYYPFPSAPLGLPASSDRISNFPRLEYLSLDGLSNPSGLLSFHSLERAFPRISRLEVHGLRGALSFARDVVEAVAERDGELKGLTHTETGSVSRLPRTLASLSLFLAPESYHISSKRGRTIHAEMLKLLLPLVEEREGIKFTKRNLHLVLHQL